MPTIDFTHCRHGWPLDFCEECEEELARKIAALMDALPCFQAEVVLEHPKEERDAPW